MMNKYGLMIDVLAGGRTASSCMNGVNGSPSSKEILYEERFRRTAGALELTSQR